MLWVNWGLFRIFLLLVDFFRNNFLFIILLLGFKIRNEDSFGVKIIIIGIFFIILLVYNRILFFLYKG